jgi:hypothetical protein
MTNASDQAGRSWARWLVRALVVLILASIGLGGWMVYRGVTTSVEAERTLHATLFTTRLVNKFVAERGRWPDSWEELDRFPFADDLYDVKWPAVSPEMRRRVQVDFQINPREVAWQDPMSFSAVKPIGPHYEYRDYREVASLQSTMRSAVRAAAAP